MRGPRLGGGRRAAFDEPAFSPAPFDAVLARLEAGGRPAEAAPLGTALGGASSWLACHAPGDAEITLGLVPGSLGTQRLPRLVGLERARRLMATGASVAAAAALEMGLVDALAEDVGPEAGAAARRPLGQALRRASRMEGPDPVTAGETVRAARAEALAKPHLPAFAALAALAGCLEAAGAGLEAGERVAAAAFARLPPSAPARALRHVFLAERAVAKLPGLVGQARPWPAWARWARAPWAAASRLPSRTPDSRWRPWMPPPRGWRGTWEPSRRPSPRPT